MERFLLDNLSPFKRARVKLTGYYLLSTSVLIVLFTVLTLNAKESSFIRVHNAVDAVVQEESEVAQFEQTFADFNRRFRQRLFVFDGVMFVVAAGLSWWMAGQTLKPIRRMMRQQRHFAADVSHELRTPLTTIRLEVETALKSLPLSKTEGRELLTSILEEVVRMTHMSQGLLAMVRESPLTHEELTDEVEMDALLAKAHKQMLPQAKQKDIALILEQESEQSSVLGSFDQLLQVVLILIDNAIKYSPRKSEVRMELTTDKSGVVVNIVDEGEGIPEKEQEAIFKRRYRAERAKQTRGSGLGLSIAAAIVHTHNGTIRVSSARGKGSVFSLRIPLHIS